MYNEIKTYNVLYITMHNMHNMQNFMKKYSGHNGVASSSTNVTTPQNYDNLFKQFPKIKFSYESKPDKKVSQNNHQNNIKDSSDKDNVYFIIPTGKKFLVWFKNNECLFLELNNERQITTITKKFVSRMFPNDTILYGTHFFNRISKERSTSMEYYFTIENIHYYDGINLDMMTVFEKLEKINCILKSNEKQQHFSVEIGLPHISTSIKVASEIKPLYSAYCIQKKNCKNASNEVQTVFYYNYKKSSSPLSSSPIAPIVATVATVATVVTNTIPKPISAFNKSNNGNNRNNRCKIFMIRADIQNDVYHLSELDSSSNDSNANENIASIPDYKTSVMMNYLFRNIKENKSLDALEESDDEDEFENVNLDKFVDLSKKIKMNCVYNYKFKKWTPISRID